MANISNIAKEAGTSIATVSRVLNNKGGVSEQLKSRVRNVVHRKGLTLRSLVDRATNLAVIIHTPSPVIDGFCSSVLEGISTYAFEKSVEANMMFLPVNGKEQPSVLQKVRDNQCDGVLFVFPQHAKSQLDELIDAGIPVMLINSQADIDGVGYLDNDSYAGMYNGVKYLIDLGHKKIGFLCDELENFDHERRLSGYRKAMTDSGIEIKSSWVVYHTPTIRAMEAGYIQAKRLLNENPEITAIVANNDAMAYGAINGLVEMGYKVPEDISVVGFDDLPSSKYGVPALTTLRQPIVELGYRAAKYLDLYSIGQIKEMPREIFSTELVVRKSTAPPRVK